MRVVNIDILWQHNSKVKLNFPYKVWLTTILLSPILIITGYAIYNSARLTEIVEAYPMILLMILFGFGLSLPALFLFQLLYKELTDSPIRAVYKKGIFAIAGTNLIYITFYFFDRDFFQNAGLYELWWPGAYSIILTFSTTFYKMKKQVDQQFPINTK